jgi:hypothetical protein
MRAVSSDNQVVLHQSLGLRGIGLDPPLESGGPPVMLATGNVYLAPGAYEFSIYSRTCRETCRFLLPPEYACTSSITVEANESLRIDYNWATCDDDL